VFERYIFKRYWDVLVQGLPGWLPANVLTLFGFVMPVWLIVDICQSSADFNQTLPFRVILWGIIAHLWAQTLCAVSAKHAVRTDRNNAAAELLRYNLGLVSLLSSWMSVCALVFANGDPFSLIALAIPTICAQYAQEFIIYCTEKKTRSENFSSISDQLVIGLVLNILAFQDPNGNYFFQKTLRVVNGYEPPRGYLTIMIYIMSGLSFCVNNFVIGIVEGTSPNSSIKLLFPFVSFAGLLFGAKHSRFY